MIIARNTVAKLLETNPTNIKDLRKVNNNIYIRLKDFDDELFMTIQEYQNCSQELKRNKEHIKGQQFLTIATIIGTFIFLTLSSINTDLASNDSSQNSTIQFVVDR